MRNFSNLKEIENAGGNEIIIIAAMSENRIIGKNNALPWSIKEDMARFRRLTEGFPCIMGRKTWESLPKKPLPGRLNIVISKTMTNEIKDVLPDVLIFSSLPAAIQRCVSYKKMFICGGERIYREALSFANKIELTLLHKEFEGDASFPEIDTACWAITGNINFDTFSFISYTRICSGVGECSVLSNIESV